MVCYGGGVLTKIGYGHAPTIEDVASADDDSEDAYNVKYSPLVKRLARQWIRKALKNKKRKSELKRTGRVDWPGMGKSILCTKLNKKSVLTLTGFDAVSSCGKMESRIRWS
mgnify:CR=1 FL=1